jgi:hypothetical protein
MGNFHRKSITRRELLPYDGHYFLDSLRENLVRRRRHCSPRSVWMVRSTRISFGFNLPHPQ